MTTRTCRPAAQKTYRAWIIYATAQTLNGDSQEFCTTCERWVYPADRCADFVRDERAGRQVEAAYDHEAK